MTEIKHVFFASVLAAATALVTTPAMPAGAPPSPKVPALEKAARDSVPVADTDFSVLERQSQLKFYPCSQCHDAMEPNPEERRLYAPHVKKIKHGQGVLWCLTCHSQDQRNQLITLRDEALTFNEAYRVCEQCHQARAKDWHFGGHGKRVGHWQGERVIYSCPECHNPHKPKIARRTPQPPPPGRVGLPTPTDHEIDRIMPWDWERNPLVSEQSGEPQQ